MAGYGLSVARKQKIPCILTYHTPVDMYVRHVSSNEYIQESLKTLYRIWEAELFERCDLITFPSTVIKDLLKDEIGESIVFSNGIDTDFFKEDSPKKFLADFDVPKGNVIGFAGRHSYEKHLEDLIGIADEFDGTILIGGDGPVRKDYEEMAKGKDNIRFLGFLPRNRMCEFYSALDALVLPSTAETEGLVVLEANACGTPVVGADALALKETIVDGINGYKYKSGDKKDSLLKLKKTCKERKKLEKSSKKYAKEHSVENTTKKLVSIYENLKK